MNLKAGDKVIVNCRMLDLDTSIVNKLGIVTGVATKAMRFKYYVKTDELTMNFSASELKLIVKYIEEVS